MTNVLAEQEQVDRLEKMVRYYERQADEAAGYFVRADAQLSITRRDLTQNILAFNILSHLRETISLHEHGDISGGVDQLFNNTLALIHSVLHVDRSLVFLSNGTGAFKAAYHLGMPHDGAKRLPLLSFEFSPEQMGGKPFLLVNRQTKSTEFIEALRELLGVRFFVCVPLTTGNEHFGFLLSSNDKEAYPFYPPFNERHYETFTAIAGFISVSYANLLLYRDLAQAKGSLEQYNQQLESMVRERTDDLHQKNDQLSREKERSEELLLNLLPEETARELQTTGQAIPRDFDSVTVIMADIIDFSSISERLDADEIVSRLDQVFRAFDHIVDRHGLEKIKTIGDAYMVAGGLPTENDTHPLDAVEACLAMSAYLEGLKQQRRFRNSAPMQMRFGIHTGPVAAGVVGSHKFAYDIWGNTVNIAKRMESASEAGRINVSRDTYDRVKHRFSAESRGAIEIKGGREVEMFYIQPRR